MKKMSKSDQDEVLRQHAAARRYEKSAHRAAAWWKNTGTAMFEPGELTRLRKEGKEAERKIAEIQSKYR